MKKIWNEISHWARRHPVKAVLAGLSTLVLLLAMVATWVNFGQAWPAIRVSRETTYITAPLKSNGMPDYVAAINEMMREEVTPDTNAMVLLQKATGPSPDYAGIEFGHAMADELGVPRLTSGGVYFVTENEFLDALVTGLKEDERRERVEEFSEEFRAAYSRPWTRADSPDVADWIEQNREPLQQVHEAARRSGYFRPAIVPSSGAISERLLMSSSLPDVQLNRTMSRMLAARAMWHLHEHRFREARADLMTVHRLARLISRGWTLVEVFVAMAMENEASEGDVQLALHPDLPAGMAREYREELRELPPLITVGALKTIVDRGERMAALDLIVAMRDQPDLWDGFSGLYRMKPPPFLLDSTPRLTMDLNETLIVVNRAFDQLVEAVGEPDESRRMSLKRELERVRTKRETLIRQLTENPVSVFLAGPQGRGVILGECFAFAHIHNGYLIHPNLQACATRRQRSVLALALSEYKTQHGRFPPSLAELVPEFLDEIPIDSFSGEVWIYHVSEDGQAILTYSIGEDRGDDNGRTRNEPTGPKGDDIPIQVGTLPETTEGPAAEVEP